MKAYTSLLKIIGIILLIPLGIALVVILAFAGFGIDFSNAWGNSSSGTGTMYMFILPIGFITITGWIIYTLSRRNAMRKTESQELKIRQQVYREQELGTNPHEVIVNVLTRQGSKTALELSVILGIDEEQTLNVISELLQLGKIQQDFTQQPSRFYITS